MARLMLIVGIIAPLLICSGCGKPMSYSDAPVVLNWGQSYETQKQNQIANPEAGKKVVVAEGLDGIAGEKTMENYHKSFENITPRPVYNVTLGPIGNM